MIQAAIDHLVVTAPSLASGAAYIRDQLGVDMQPGGTHPAMGTHNLLLRLDESTYLEVLAIDLDMTAPGHPRWFNLDRVTTPGLATWVARVDDIHAAALALGIPAQHIKPMSRGALNWLITIPDGGNVHETMPVLIQWLNGPHPAASMRPSDCSLKALQTGFDGASQLELDPRCTAGRELVASIQSPHGLRTLANSS
ncbi:MAG TPA: VOC family protein [Candidatus Krumholzibacteria bacterium]|nr:VOC family protein [Candidatus Krumholzibacteria bacterium]